MGRICTNPHQSNKLTSRGFSAKAADLWWSQYELVYQPTPMMQHFVGDPVLYTYQTSSEDIPAWSLTTLLQALPDTISYDDEIFNLHITKAQNYYLVEYTSERASLLYRDGRDLIDICVQVIIHLIDNDIPLNSAYLYDNI